MRNLSRKKNIQELQVRYGAIKEKVFKISLSDDAWPLYFQVRNGEFNVWYEDKAYDAEVIMTMDTFLNIMHRRCMMTNHKTGLREEAPFSFWDAHRFGLIKGRGDASTNDFKHFAQIFDELIAEVHAERSGLATDQDQSSPRPLA